MAQRPAIVARRWAMSSPLHAGVDDQEQVVGAARHHQVVADPAGVVGEEGVALLALGQADDVDRHQRLERGRRIVADQAQLAHVRDVEQAPPPRGSGDARRGCRPGTRPACRSRRTEPSSRRARRAARAAASSAALRSDRGRPWDSSGARFTPTGHLRVPRENCPGCPLYLRDWQRRERRCLPLRWARSRRTSLQRGRLRASVCQSSVPERSTAPLPGLRLRRLRGCEALSWRRSV